MINPPVAKIVPHQTEMHGDVRVDPYHWLREKSNPEVIAHLEAENSYTEAVMAPAAPLREKLYQEIVGRIRQSDSSVPERRGAWLYYTRTEQGKQYAIWCRKAAEDAPEQILLDGNVEAEGHAYFRIGSLQPSPDHTMIAYTVDVEGDEVYSVSVKDLGSGAVRADVVRGASAALEWGNDNRTLFYTILDEAKRPYKLFRHELGAGASDALVYHEADERFNLDFYKCKSGAYIFLDLNSHSTTEYRYIDADAPGGEPVVMLERRQGVEYEAAHHGDSFYIRINDASTNFRLVRLRGGAVEEVRPHREDLMLEHVDAFRDHLVLLEREGGLRHITVVPASGGAEHRVAFDGQAYAVDLAGNPEFDTPVLRFHYSSLVTPMSVFDYDMYTRERILRKQTEVVGGFNAADYVEKRAFCTSFDGTKVPISIVHRKDFVANGQAPALLYGYGAYGLNSEPNFSSGRLSLIDRGFVYAIAHIRGGSEMGRKWYETGKLQHKPNTFHDFIACAEYLIAEGYTSPKRLAIHGGSAGGLLLGAVLNMRADLFRAAVTRVPFVDMLNTMLDASLPLTIPEYEEWGDPNNPEVYRCMRSYSPYDNMRRQEWPRLLVTTGLNDPRVAYWEPAKWVARMRTLQVGDAPPLLKINMDAGHFGASGRYERFKEIALDYAFLLRALEVTGSL